MTISEWQEGASYALSEEEGVEAQGYSLVDRKSSTRSRFKTSIFEESKKKKKDNSSWTQWPRRKGEHVEVRYKSCNVREFE